MAKTGETVAELLVRRVTEAGRAALVAGGAPSSSHFTWFGVPGDYRRVLCGHAKEKASRADANAASL